MMRRIVVILTALAMAPSSSIVLAGNGQQTRGKRSQSGTCLMQKSPARKQARTSGAGGAWGYGPGNLGVRPQDGTGFGNKAGIANGTGTCDSEGPHGLATRRGSGNPPR